MALRRPAAALKKPAAEKKPADNQVVDGPKNPAGEELAVCLSERHDGPAWTAEEVVSKIRSWCGCRVSVSSNTRPQGPIHYRFQCLECTDCSWRGLCSYANGVITFKATPESCHTDRSKLLGVLFFER